MAGAAALGADGAIHPRAEFGTLDWLFAPGSRREFLGWQERRQPGLIQRSDTTYYRRLFSRRDLDFALHAGSRGPTSAVEIISASQGHTSCESGPAAEAAFRQGRSLRINGVHRFLPRLATFCRAVEQSLAVAVNINAYATPAGERALARHYDSHDVLILQTQGRKQWFLYDPPVEFPLESFPALQAESSLADRKARTERGRPACPASCTLREDFILSAGDLLYLPSGVLHEARAIANLPSCHLTVGLYGFTYLDLLTIALRQRAEREPELRALLPLGFAATDDRGSEIAARAQGLAGRLGEGGFAPALAELAEILAAHRGPIEQSLFTPSISAPTAWRRAEGAVLTVAEVGGAVCVRCGQSEIRRPSF